jgi:hypothetical protein
VNRGLRRWRGTPEMQKPGDGPEAVFHRACFKVFNRSMFLRDPGGEGGQAGPLIADAFRFSFGTLE